jgi:regulator of RNase E activity RraA
MSESLLARIGHFDTCTISDAMDRLGLNGVAEGLRRITTHKRIAGPVRTVKLESAEGRTSDRHLGTDQIDAGLPGEVIVVEHHDRTDCAGWGGLLSAAALSRGIAGTVVDGMCRDVDDSESVAYPVFAKGSTPRTARARIVQTDQACEVTIGGVKVKPGDWVVADGTGVVFIPKAALGDVIAKAADIAAKEQQMLDAIRRRIPVTRVMSGDYENMLR